MSSDLVRLSPERIYQVETNSPEETLQFGRRLAHDLRPPCWVLLEGELGSGKTTLAKGIVAGLGVATEDEVTSPTFTLVHEYGKEQKVFHADLYRVESPQELATLGLDEGVEQGGTVIVEWGEKLADSISLPGYRIRLELLSGEQRRITVERLGA